MSVGYSAEQRHREFGVEEERESLALGIPRRGDLVPAEPGGVAKDDVRRRQVGEDLVLRLVAVEQVVIDAVGVGQQISHHALGEYGDAAGAVTWRSITPTLPPSPVLLSPLFCHHSGDRGQRFARSASTPSVRPAAPISSASEIAA